MRTIFISAIMSASILLSAEVPAQAFCSDFSNSTMKANNVAPVEWRMDYSASKSIDPDRPWGNIDFTDDPRGYMDAVKTAAAADFKRSGKTLTTDGTEKWWITPWLDYTPFGREPLMGLTKERGPNPGDLSMTSKGGHQVWAVGFYNAYGARVLNDIYANKCDPKFPKSVKFAEGTVAIKFLFTDAPDIEVEYLKGAPVYEAFIDKKGSGSRTLPPDERKRREMRLLQFDIAVRDADAAETGWVFGTFGWVGPKKGDGLFDNLVPVSLQWGDDPGIYDTAVKESWINQDLEGDMFGWDERPTLGFNGRANGPADNIKSSCISCHATARAPNRNMRLLNGDFDYFDDIGDAAKVKKHVDGWFVNLPAGELFNPSEPAVSALDYSLQLDAARYRMCKACNDGVLIRNTPKVCSETDFPSRPTCVKPPPVAGVLATPSSSATFSAKSVEEEVIRTEDTPPRQ